MGGSQSQDTPTVAASGGQHAAYHSGVELYGGEYVFGGGDSSFSGVTVQRPRVPPPGSGWVFYQSVDIAPCRKSRDEALRIIQDMRAEFPASSYDLMARNCNHFSDALCQRLCNQGIPSWVNRLAGLGNAVRSAVGGAPTAAPKVKAEGAGGPAAAGLVARSVDGDLLSEVDWPSAGVLNASESDPTEALRSGGVSSDADGSPELLLLLPFISPVKLQKLVLESSIDNAPKAVRLFANSPNLDMDDAAGGAATQEFGDINWAGTGPVATATIDVNFLKFQKLSFLAVYAKGDEDSGHQIKISKLGLEPEKKKEKKYKQDPGPTQRGPVAAPSSEAPKEEEATPPVETPEEAPEVVSESEEESVEEPPLPKVFEDKCVGNGPGKGLQDEPIVCKGRGLQKTDEDLNKTGRCYELNLVEQPKLGLMNSGSLATIDLDGSLARTGKGGRAGGAGVYSGGSTLLGGVQFASSWGSKSAGRLLVPSPALEGVFGTCKVWEQHPKGHKAPVKQGASSSSLEQSLHTKRADLVSLVLLQKTEDGSNFRCFRAEVFGERRHGQVRGSCLFIEDDLLQMITTDVQSKIESLLRTVALDTTLKLDVLPPSLWYRAGCVRSC
ncbi:DESI2 [Symbiodinium microadriaticum]|nr:DESI2 [Symbiodinium microadriaticum]